MARPASASGGQKKQQDDDAAGGGADAGADESGTAEHTAMFALWIGNGVFWTFPFLLQWLAGRTIGSGLIDNGRLDGRRFQWLVWGAFLAYFVTGGFFNLVMHLQLFHRWR